MSLEDLKEMNQDQLLRLYARYKTFDKCAIAIGVNRNTFSAYWYDAKMPNPKFIQKIEYEMDTYKLAACSDLHLGSKQQCLTPFCDFIQTVMDQDIKTLVIPGDICEGLMPRPGHAQVRFLHSIDDIYNYVYNVFADFADSFDEIAITCLSDDTEVYTKNGWKLHGDIATSDKILSIVDNRLVFNNVVDVIRKEYNGDMIKFKSQSVDMLVTPDHMSYCASYTTKNFKYVKSSDLLRNKHVLFKMAGNIIRKDFDISDDMLAIIGLIVTEGTYLKNGGIQIYQEDITAQPIRDLVTRTFGYCSEYKGKGDHGRVFYIKVKDAAIIRKEYLINKLDIKYLLNVLSCRQLHILFDWMVFGDGCWNTGGNSGSYYTANKTLADDFQILCTYIGYRSHIYIRTRDVFGYKNFTEYSVQFVKQNWGSTSTNADIVKYDGVVFDLVTEIGNFLIRRNGKIAFTGNCGNHDESLNRRSMGFNICENLANDFKTIIYNDNPMAIVSPVKLNNGLKIALYHGHGGCAKNLVTRTRSVLTDIMNSTDDFDMLFAGHCHRYSSDRWLQRYCYSLGAFQSTTHFLAQGGKTPDVRGEIISYKLNDKGRVFSDPIVTPYRYDDCIVEHDY